MISPALERRYADCTELVEAWKGFLEFFNKTIKDTTFQPSPDVEQAFLDAKARIAMLHDSFMAALKHDQNVGQNMLAIVNRSITLRHLRKLGVADQKKIEIEWHECYLLLNETTSTLAEERERLAEVNEFTYKVGKVRERIIITIKWFLSSIYFKVIVAVGILGGLGALLLLNEYDSLRNMKGIGEPYGSFLDFRRDKLGMDSSYSSLAKLLEGKLAEGRMPADYKRRDQENSKDTVAASFQGGFKIDGQDATDFLKSADDFKTVAFDKQGAPSVSAWIFFWKDSKKARNFANTLDREAQNPTNTLATYYGNAWTTFYDNNILIILSGPRKEDQQPVKRDVFKKH